MTAIRADDAVPKPMLHFLRRCYKFMNEEWQHAGREALPDQGFEQNFRTSCMKYLGDWEISPQREMHLGSGLDTASGLGHEVDVVAKHSDVTAVVETKNRQGLLPDKNDVIVFFAKLLDFLACNPALLLREICPVFMSNAPFEESGLVACLGLGIHPIAPGLRPVPILIDNALRIDIEFRRGIKMNGEVNERFEDFCAQLNRLSFALRETWLTSRCGYHSENTIVVRAAGALNVSALSDDLRLLNGDCAWLLDEIRKAKL